jgi:hypothetical protein
LDIVGLCAIIIFVYDPQPATQPVRIPCPQGILQGFFLWIASHEVNADAALRRHFNGLQLIPPIPGSDRQGIVAPLAGVVSSMAGNSAPLHRGWGEKLIA